VHQGAPAVCGQLILAAGGSRDFSCCRSGWPRVLSDKEADSVTDPGPDANNESSEVCGIIKPGRRGRRFELNRSQAVHVHKLLTIHYLRPGPFTQMTPYGLATTVQCIVYIYTSVHICQRLYVAESLMPPIEGDRTTRNE